MPPFRSVYFFRESVKKKSVENSLLAGMEFSTLFFDGFPYGLVHQADGQWEYGCHGLVNVWWPPIMQEKFSLPKVDAKI